MLSRSSWLHLRIPFSYFLLPVFLFSLALSPNFGGARMFWVFFIVHFLLYPASNGYNSYFDKDEKSIGGLKNPPPVKKGLYYLALFLDIIAIVLGYLKISLTFSMMLLVYGLVSKAYSHPSTRLKKYAIASWFIAGTFQGMFTFLMCYVGINNFSLENCLREKVLIPALLTTFMLWAIYPITQVYQHDEDAWRGDHTLSRMLGIKGTFYFAAIMFSIAFCGFILFLRQFHASRLAMVFAISLLPAILYFLYWFIRVAKDPAQANFGHTMRMNFIAATCLNFFFIYLFVDQTNILQLIP